MAFSPASGQPHQSPQSSLPPLSAKQVNTGTWGAGGNVCVITDAEIHPNSVIIAYVTGTTIGVQAAGNWSYSVSQGSCTITSSDGEDTSLPVSYIVI